jgi:two-component system phosphate regulon sensor histidine kinase PhoR
MIVLRTLIFVVLLLVAAAAAGFWINGGTAAWVLVVGLGALATYHAVFLGRLHHWAALPRQRELPIAFGSWGQVYDRIGRYMRQEAIERTETSAELERLHAAVDLLPDGLVVLDRFDHVQWSNRAAQALHGIFGTRRPIDHFIRNPEFVDYLRQGDFTHPIILAPSGALHRMVALKVVPTVDAYRLLVSRDVTESNRVEQIRRDFVANVSHEIRTPLTVVAGFIETLIDADLPAEDRRRYLETVLRQTGTMQQLVSDLLTLASLEHSSDLAELTPIDITPMLQTLAADLRVVSAGRHTIDVVIATPATVLGAPSELDSAIRNLLSNAVRYTPDGGKITLHFSLRDGEGVIAVQDSGIGIAREHLPRLTERFYRVDRGRSRDTGGTGLGLAIVKHVAQRHQARLDIESRPGLGSTFSITLPHARVRASGPSESTARLAENQQV